MLSRMKIEREKHGVAPDVRNGDISRCLLGTGFVRKRSLPTTAANRGASFATARSTSNPRPAPARSAPRSTTS